MADTPSPILPGLAGVPCVPRVLVLHADPDARANLRRQLRGYVVAEAETGAAGVQRILADPPDCVLLHDHLPDMDTLGLLAALAGPQGLPVCPVVVLSAPTIGRAALRAGAQDYLGEDERTPEGLARAIDNATARWQVARELQDRNRQLDLLARSAHRLLTADDREHAVRAISEDLGRTLGMDTFYHFRPCPTDPRFLRLHASGGTTPAERERFATIRFGELLCGRVAEARARLVVEDLQRCDQPGSELLAAGGVTSYAGFPLVAGDVLFGTLAFLSRRRTHFHADEILTVQAVCDQLAIAMERDRLAAAVRASEERLRRAVEAGGMGTWDLDLTTGRAVWSAEHFIMLGYPPDPSGEASSGMWTARIHPDDLDRVLAAIDAARRDRTEFAAEYRIVRAGDGRVAWLSAVGRFQYDASGKAARFVGVDIDITARRRTEDANRERDALLALACDGAGLMPFTWDVQADRIERWRSRVAALPSTDDGPTTLDGVIGVLHPDDRAAFAANVRAALAAPEEPYTNAYRVLQADGSELWLEDRGRVSVDARGRPTRLVGVAMDVTSRKRTEQALRASEAFTQQLADLAPSILYVYDLDGQRNVWGNREMTSLLGYTREQIEGLAGNLLGALLHPDDRLPYQAHAGRLVALADGEAAEFEYRMRQVDGSWRWLLSRDMVLRRAADGRPTQIVGSALDITDRKRAAEALRASEERFRAVFEHAGTGIAVTRPTGQLLQCNPAFERIVGYAEGELKALRPGDIIHPDDRADDLALMRRLLDREATSFEVENRYLHRTGRAVWVHKCVSVLVDRADRPVCHVVLVTDVTARRQTEADLRASEQRLRLAAEAAGVGIWEWHVPSGRVLWDAQMFRIYGLPPTADGFVPYTAWSTAVLPDDLDAQDATLQTTSRLSRRAFRIRRGTDGEVRHIEAVETVRAHAGGAAEWVLGTNIDVTDRVRAEVQLRDADRRKDEFLATLAHELRNPLAPLRNGLQLLRLQGTDDAVARVRDMMERQLSHLVHLVDDLLDISRVSQGKITLKRERLPVREAVEAAIEACRPAIDARGHALALELPAEPLPVDGDRTRLVQVIVNLLTNAAKYTDPGGRIAVAARRDGADAVIAVADAGVGIAPEVLPTLWDMFTQVRDTLDKAQGGLGIGLSLVKKLVEMHGGSVTAASGGVGGGSTFTVRLPLAGPIPPPATAPRRPRPAAAGRQILIVDDNEDGAETLALMLEMFGHHTRVASTGPAAVDAARSSPPELVFCDIGLPGMDGYEVARRLRDDPRTARAVLIAITGWGSEDDKRRSLAAGFDAHLTKPVEANALQDLLAECPQPPP